MSGSFYRSKLKYLSFLRKRCNVNPKRGPFHHRAPSKIFQRAIRGMLPFKTIRGRMALKRVKAFEGCPPPYDKTKRNIVPEAKKNLRLKPGRKFCSLGRLSHEVGWQYQGIVRTLEKRRKIRNRVAFKERVKEEELRKQAVKIVKKMKTPQGKVLVSYGFVK